MISPQDNPVVEELIADSRQRPASTLARRERISEPAMSLGFLIVAAAFLALVDSGVAFDPAVALGLAAAHVVAQRVEFEVGAGRTSPTQLVLIPMLILLPLEWVPAIVAACMLLGRLPECVNGERHAARVLLAPADAWHAIGPVAVLVAAGSPEPALSLLPLYGLALLAQFAVDTGVGVVREWLALGVPPRLQLRLLGWVMAVDAMLAPIGLLAGLVAVGQPWAVALLLPLVGLMGLFASEHRRQVDQALQLSTAYRGTALLMSDMLQADDEYTGGEHSDGVVAMSLQVASELGVEGAELRNLEFAALLHDVGKIVVPKEIINKPGKLTPAEWEFIKLHPVTGQELLDRIGGTLADVGQVVRSHHERWDGGGYPDGLAGIHIPLGARIICACDAFSAMTTDRPYRQAMPIADALAELGKCAGEQFDPHVVNALTRVVCARELRGKGGRPVSLELVLTDAA